MCKVFFLDRVNIFSESNLIALQFAGIQTWIKFWDSCIKLSSCSWLMNQNELLQIFSGSGWISWRGSSLCYRAVDHITFSQAHSAQFNCPRLNRLGLLRGRELHEYGCKSSTGIDRMRVLRPDPSRWDGMNLSLSSNSVTARPSTLS